MGETGMSPGSDTRSRPVGPEQKAEMCSSSPRPVTTDHTSNYENRYAVRVDKSEVRVVVQVDTERLVERNKIKAANDSIRRRSR